MSITQLTPSTPPPPMTERELQDSIVGLCKWFHLLVYHTYDSRRCAAGFPDLVIIGTRILAWELKSASGELTRTQTHYKDAFEEVGEHCPNFVHGTACVEYAVIRPVDWHSGRVRTALESIMFRAAGGPVPAAPHPHQRRPL